MRALAASLVVLAGCAEISGLGTLEVCDGACVDATADAALVTDAPTTDGAIDAQAPPNDTGTPDVPIISDGTVPPPLGCTRTSNCTQNELCCGSIATQGQAPNCQVKTVTSQCTASCTTSFDFQKCGTDTVRLCASNQECTEQAYNRCCKYSYADASISICTNLALADASGGVCP
jgi:hypothetical protein